jgi:hypothetical protein
MKIELIELRLTRAQFNDLGPKSRAACADIVKITDEPVAITGAGEMWVSPDRQMEEPPCARWCGRSTEEGEWMGREEQGYG